MITVDFKKAELKPGQKILDIGCGSGRHVAAAYQYPGVTVIGTDLSFQDLVEARERLMFHDRLGAHGRGAWGLNVADIKAVMISRFRAEITCVTGMDSCAARMPHAVKRLPSRQPSSANRQPMTE